MISPHTPPGTRILCINDDPDLLTTSKNKDMNGLMKGSIYTVQQIELCPFWKMPTVILTEIKRYNGKSIVRGYGLERFRRLELPSCLTSLLSTVPISVTETETV